MSNVKTKLGQNHPLKTRNQVGNTIGERRLIQQKPQVTRIPVRKQIDQFNRGQKPKNLAKFSAKAIFNSGRRFTSREAPYKRPLHEHVEKGTAPVHTGPKAPSDPTILRFLDKIISTPALHNGVRLRKASAGQAAAKKTAPRSYPAGRPAVPTKSTARVRTRPVPKVKS